jgi:hypothetical protein
LVEHLWLQHVFNLVVHFNRFSRDLFSRL